MGPRKGGFVKIVALDKERHSGKGSVRPVGYGFAAGNALAPLGGSEFAKQWRIWMLWSSVEVHP
jgi:hypothetical protein